MNQYETVYRDLERRLEDFDIGSKIVWEQLDATFLGGTKPTLVAIVDALQAVVDATRMDIELLEAPF